MRTQSKGASSIWSSELVAGMLAFLCVNLNRMSGGMETGKRACPPTSPARPRRPVTGMTSQRGIRPKAPHRPAEFVAQTPPARAPPCLEGASHATSVQGQERGQLVASEHQ